MFIPDPDLIFYPSRIPYPGVKKALDPGSGIQIATLKIMLQLARLTEQHELNGIFWLDICAQELNLLVFKDFLSAFFYCCERTV